MLRLKRGTVAGDAQPKRTCSVEGCERVHKAYGLCRRHYERERYATDPEYRERQLKNARKPAYLERKKARRRVRYAVDPEYADDERTLSRERYRRWIMNPQNRARVNARSREYNEPQVCDGF